jgi:Raf kinase inhibitor-like YbhB/YbcL family protein
MIHVEPYTGIKNLVIVSRVFEDQGEIPRKYTCDGLNVNPPIDISFIPQQAKSMAVIMEDPDAPISTWTHWLVWNLPVTHQIRENTYLGKNGINDFSRHFYCGPCPMSGRHHYVFKVYALNCLLNLPVNTKKIDLERAMAGNIIAYGELTGIYGRK